MTIVARNDRLARERIEIEISKPCAANVDVVAISARGRKAWPLVRDPIEVCIASGSDIEWRAGSGDDEGTKHQLPPGRIDRAKKRKPMPYVIRGAPKLTAEIV